jgi:hypothetical protein
MVLGVYHGCPPEMGGSGSLVGYNDDGGESPNSLDPIVRGALTSGSTYFLFIGVYGGTPPNTISIATTLSITF